LTINVNKYNSLHAGCRIELLREIKMKRTVINVQSMDNACFAWAVVVALYPVERNAERKLSYPNYMTVLNLKDIEFSMTLNQIKKFENRNNIFINVYCIEKKKELLILPIQVTDRKRTLDKSICYMLQDNNDKGHFVWIKNLSRLVNSQINRKEHKKFFCDRYVYLLKL